MSSISEVTFFIGLMERNLKLIGLLTCISDKLRQSSHSDRGIVLHPFTLFSFHGAAGGIVAHEERIHSQNIRAVFVDNIVRVNDISFGFTHLFAVGTEDKTLCGTFCVRLFCGNYADVIEEAIPESGIDEVAGNMLHASVVPVYGKPILHSFIGRESFVVVRVAVTDEVP